MADTTLQNESMRTNWQAAWAAYEAAKAEADRYEATVFNPAYEAAERAIDGLQDFSERQRRQTLAVPGFDAISERMDELNDKAHSEEGWKLLLTPAPDRDALEWKMNRLFGDNGEYSTSYRMDGVNAFLADVRRLLNH